jgi:hypothetical protein
MGRSELTGPQSAGKCTHSLTHSLTQARSAGGRAHHRIAGSVVALSLAAMFSGGARGCRCETAAFSSGRWLFAVFGRGELTNSFRICPAESEWTTSEQEPALVRYSSEQEPALVRYS